jgi:CRP-like cAMP-binding protein/HEAT repeat protein
MRVNTGVFVGKLLNVRPAEWPRLRVLLAMIAILLVGSSWGEPIVEAAFLRQVGVQYLPLVIMVNAVLSIGLMACYTAFADRMANNRLMVVILGGGMAGILLGLGLLTGGLIFIAFPLLYFVANVPLTDIFNVHWATYVNGFYDTRAARRIVPLLGAGSRLAAIVAGLSMPLINRLLPPPGIIVLWLASVAGMALLVWQMPRLLHEDAPAPTNAQAQGARPGVLAHLREGYGYVRRSPFLRVMAAAGLLTTILLAFVNYQTGKLLVARLSTVQDISNFTGLVSGLGNLVALPFQLFFLSRLINRIGLGNSFLIFPAATVATCGALIAAPGLPSVALGQLDRGSLRTSLRNPIESLLYNAVPLRMKGRARGFIAGLMGPVGSLIGGGLLLLLQAGVIWVATAVLVLVSALAVALIISSALARREYRRAMIALLEQEDYSSLLVQEGQELAAAEPATLQLLRERLVQPGAKPDLMIFMAELISQVGGNAAGPILAEACRTTTDARLRSALLDILSVTGLRGDVIRQLCLDCLTDPDPRVRQSAIGGLESADGIDDQTARGFLLKMTSDTDCNVRVRALLALAERGDFDDLPEAAAALQGLLADPDSAVRSRGVRVLAQLDTADAHEQLLPFLIDPADDVRLEAALALEARRSKLSGAAREQLPGLAGVLLHDAVERVRLVALTLLQGNHTPAACALFVQALADTSPQVRGAATRALVDIGTPAVAWVRPLAESETGRPRQVAVAVLCRINVQGFAGEYGEPAIRAGLERISQDQTRLDALAACDDSRGLAALRCALAERDRQWLSEVFDLLGAIYGDEPMRLVRSSLNSTEARVRANAVEALEAVASPALARAVGQVCEPASAHRPPTATRPASSSEYGGESSGVVLRQLAGDVSDPLVQAVATFAEGELSGTQSTARVTLKGGILLSTIERILFLKEVPFFAGMTIEQLRVLATVCEEELFAADQRIFHEGDPGGTLYCVVSGRVALEQEKRKGAFARLATLEAHGYFGEMNLFDDSPRSVTALAIQDTLALRLRREPLIALVRQYPDLSLELINVLSERLRELSDRTADLTRTRPRQLHRLYDQLDMSTEN